LNVIDPKKEIGVQEPVGFFEWVVEGLLQRKASYNFLFVNGWKTDGIL
jgi:hypothetical protein